MLRTLQNLSIGSSRAFATSSQPAVLAPSSSLLDSALFDDVRSRVSQNGRTMKKILVTVVNRDGSKKECLMNKNISTAFDCAKRELVYVLYQRISEMTPHHITCKISDFFFPMIGCIYLDFNMLWAKRTVLALTSYSEHDVQLECMNEPLRDKCSIELLDFQNEDYAEQISKAYWRSCSILLAAVLSAGLRDKISVSGLYNKVEKSYFAVDIVGLNDSLSPSDLRDLSWFARSEFVSSDIPFETVFVPQELACDYGLKTRQVLQCLRTYYLLTVFGQSFLTNEFEVKHTVVRLCRLGNFVTAIDGPVISRSDQVGRFSIVKTISKGDVTHVGGVSLPAAQKTSSFLWEKIVENARDVCFKKID
ncbi:hypothetical protein NECAME_14062 [Necator americanus]|uniref:Uncharacterized protein n=1 Tax=Necator americanus TaxID=51031 RepID=W2SST6_NECAM|nr:hypothetical protein NECAME_14062 [Necator americanus]ETN71906.1 hypothetical protein NECAME_14062 [Necator americanus]